MQKSLLDRRTSNSFSKNTTDFLYNNSIFKDLIQAEFSLENVTKQMELKANFESEKRAVLVEVLKQQYASIQPSASVQKNIDLLKEQNTFTVTTGHQLNIFTGPIYFLYKIIHAIKLAERLKERFPDKNFVPIYWMASEDHDFEEINHTFLYNQKIEFKSEQSGPVGEFDLENWSEIQEQISSFFKNHPEAMMHDLIKKYTGKNLSEATLNLVHELFQDYGLVILEPNNKILKQEFTSIMMKEVEELFSEKAVLKANGQLEKLGYKPQIMAREVNLFYIGKGFRERVIPKDGKFESEHLGSLSLTEIKAKIQAEPEQFSPNVVLRPVYQECILPNLVYIGGGAEIAYWTQLKGVFEHVNIPFPLLQVRNSLQIFDKNAQKKIQKLNVSQEALFQDIQALKNAFVKANVSEELDFSALEEKVMQVQSALSHVVIDLDSNLKNYAEAENTKLLKQIEAVKHKLLKHQKSQFDSELKMLEDLKNKLFPNGVLQERTDNFMNFCPDGNYKAFVQSLYEALDPLEKDLILLEV